MLQQIGLLSLSHKTIRNVLKETVRYSRINTKKNRRKREINPGVNLQSKLLNDASIDLDEVESDFMNMEKSYKQHVEAIERFKEREKCLIVEQKYFKQKLPNFLTWSDKEQIRYLYNSDPDEWTIEKLSEGFPALPEIIAKVAKATWTKSSESKIQNHDASVHTNWSLFKAGKLDIPPNLNEHLNKFTNRGLNFEVFKPPTDVEKNLPKYEGEFSAIITSYERIKNKNETKPPLESNETHKPPKNDTYLTTTFDNFTDTKRTTLSHLKHKLQKELIGGLEITDDDRILLKELDKSNEVVSNEHAIVDLGSSKTGLSTQHKSVKDYKYLEYPEKIIIPKDKLKRGYTYKLNDCFYDSDGIFLYRVPGMHK